jgi:hypothetical protein
MTSKIYRSAQGKSVDLGTIMLQNEHTRAVGNMKVNARGDKLDSNNQVVETKTQQIQRQNDRTSTNVSAMPVHTSSRKNRAAKQSVDPATQINSRGHAKNVAPTPVPEPAPAPIQATEHAPPVKNKPVESPVPEVKQATPPPVEKDKPQPQVLVGGLAGALARSREIKQELDRTRRQQAQDKGIRKI